jgi:hypothetical protein
VGVMQDHGPVRHTLGRTGMSIETFTDTRRTRGRRGHVLTSLSLPEARLQDFELNEQPRHAIF